MSTYISLRLPTPIFDRLHTLARHTGRTKTYYVREAILRHLDTLEAKYQIEQSVVDSRLPENHCSPPPWG